MIYRGVCVIGICATTRRSFRGNGHSLHLALRLLGRVDEPMRTRSHR